MSKIVDKLALFVFRDRKVLFARSRGKKLFYNVGGKRNEGETDEEALVRETKEETGAGIIPHTLSWMYTFNGPCHGAPPDTVLKMTCFKGELDREPVPSS